MRETRFRAWDGERMCNGDEFLLHGTGKFQGQSMKNSILIQYTGLKDKNGKEIYEGDLMFKQHDYPLKVVKISPDVLLKSFKDWQIIGNIYENPELLKGES